MHGQRHFSKSVPHFLSLELEPGPKPIEWEPDSWVSALSKMKV